MKRQQKLGFLHYVVIGIAVVLLIRLYPLLLRIAVGVTGYILAYWYIALTAVFVVAMVWRVKRQKHMKKRPGTVTLLRPKDRPDRDDK